MEENNIHIQLNKPGKNASSNVVLRRCYFRLSPWHLLKYDQVGISVQFDWPHALAHYELVAQQHRQNVNERLSALGSLEWKPGKIVLSRPPTRSKLEAFEERYAWLANAINTTSAVFTQIFPPAPQLKLTFHDGKLVNSDTGEEYDLLAVAARLPWQPYKRKWKDYPPYMPPHEFVVLGKCDYADWDVLYFACTKHPKSYRAYFRGYRSPMQYLELGDGYRYWPTRLGVMMLNRCTLDSVEPPRRLDQGEKPIKSREWGAPPWLPKGSGWPSDYLKKHPDVAREIGQPVDEGEAPSGIKPGDR
jgi:hypothetical protein